MQDFKDDVEMVNPKFKNSKLFSEGEIKAFLTTAKKIVPTTMLRGFSHLSF